MLSQRHPLALFAVCFAWILASLMILDLQFQIIALAGPVGLLALVERQPIRKLLMIAVPFALFGVGIVTTQILFRQGSGYLSALQAEAVWETEAGEVGLILFLRVLACGFLSALFVLTADQGRFIKALMIHCRLPASVAYALLSVLNMARDFAGEITQMRLARAMRRGRHPSRFPGPGETVALVVPALAYAIRRAERMARAMEARGFDSAAQRTVIHPPKAGIGDGILVLAGLGLLAATAWLV